MDSGERSRVERFDREMGRSDDAGNIVIGFTRLAGALVGLGVVVVGAWLAAHLFYAIFAAVTDPAGSGKIFQEWTKAVGGEDLRIKIDDRLSIPTAHILAAVVIGGALLVLSSLATGMMTAGARIISYCAGEQEAVRRILKHALGAKR